MLPDDSTVSREQSIEIRLAAGKMLRDAAAVGVFPTPVDDLMRAAKIEIVPIALDESYLAKLRRKAEGAAKALLSALSKVWGVFDPRARIAFIDPETPKEKIPFLKLHEGGHAVLPWQSVFGLFEDCRKTLDPEIKQQFEREANVFASEVLFQLDGFAQEAADHKFGISVPLRLAKRYGASVYATVRRYVTSNDKTCAVVVLNPPELAEIVGYFCTVRRAITSPSFDARFPGLVWPMTVSPDDALGKIIPVNRMTGPRTLRIVDANGDTQEFIAEAFKTPHQTFILIHVAERIRRRVLLPADFGAA